MHNEGTPILLTPQKRLGLFSQGQELFNSGHFFEAHEIWEELWNYERGVDKEFVQGLIMVAGHYVQLQKQFWSGAESLAENAKRKLLIPPSNTLYKKMDTEPLVSALNYNLSFLHSGKLHQRYYSTAADNNSSNSTQQILDDFLIPQFLEK